MCTSCLIGLMGVDGLGGAADAVTYDDLLSLCAMADDPAKKANCTTCMNKAKKAGLPSDFSTENSALNTFLNKCLTNPSAEPPAPAAPPAKSVCGSGYMQLSFLGQQYGQTCQSKLLVAGVGVGVLAAALLLWRRYAR